MQKKYGISTLKTYYTLLYFNAMLIRLQNDKNQETLYIKKNMFL